MPSIHVRARDGALYADPVLVFPEGFVEFSGGAPTLTMWLDETSPSSVVDVLQRVFGRKGEDGDAVLSTIRSLVPVDSAPAHDQHGPKRKAAQCQFDLRARIPRPTMDAGVARHPRRCGTPCLDWPSAPTDAANLLMPPSHKEPCP